MIPPCRTCPWRTSTVTEEIPGGGLDAKKCRDHRTGGPLGLGLVMQCHRSSDADPQPCAGWVVRVGPQSVMFRLAVSRGMFDPDRYTDGGAELHATYDDMVAAHLGDSEREPSLEAQAHRAIWSRP